MNRPKIDSLGDKFKITNFDSESVLQNTHAGLSGFIPLKDGESIKLTDFIKTVKDYSQQAVYLLPVSESIKKKILSEVGVEPFDIEKIKSIYKIGRQWLSEGNRNNLNVYGECTPTLLKNGKFTFRIAMENNAPPKIFHYFLYHEIDHMVGYLGSYFSLQEMDYTQADIIDILGSENWEFKTEFFARVNTANQAMTGNEARDFVFHVGTGNGNGRQDSYGQSMQYATKFIGARNRIYNLLLRKYGADENANNKYAAIKEPGNTKFTQMCRAFAEFLFFIDSVDGFRDFVDSMSEIISTSSSIEQAINRLSGTTGEIRLKAKDVELVKTLWNKYRAVLINCR